MPDANPATGQRALSSMSWDIFSHAMADFSQAKPLIQAA
jgi:hypothetical protein